MIARLIPEMVGAAKTWLADAASNTYGGVYLWDTEASCSHYKASKLFHAVKTHPNDRLRLSFRGRIGTTRGSGRCYR